MNPPACLRSALTDEEIRRLLDAVERGAVDDKGKRIGGPVRVAGMAAEDRAMLYRLPLGAGQKGPRGTARKGQTAQTGTGWQVAHHSIGSFNPLREMAAALTGVRTAMAC